MRKTLQSVQNLCTRCLPRKFVRNLLQWVHQHHAVPASIFRICVTSLEPYSGDRVFDMCKVILSPQHRS